MRLLKRKSDGELSLTKDFVDHVPAYAILSHSWGDDDQEVSFDEMKRGWGKSKEGYQKIRFCGDQAARDNLQYFWVDTCCINKLDPVELQKSINSMFRWYQNAKKCYVYLSDIRIPSHNPFFKPVFLEARWFTRGWTLQELLAPSSVEFFSADYKRLGDKHSLESMIHERAKIPLKALRKYDPTHFSVDERISWVMKRKTKHEEDMAYSLLGLCGVFLPLIYGEGKENAFRRLRQEVSQSVGNYKSEIFAKLDGNDQPNFTACLRSLAFPEMNYRRNDTQRAHTKTCGWITRHPSYSTWLEDGSGILWIKGKPGSGKSTLMEYLLRDFEKQGVYQESIQLSFFLHGRGTILQKSRLGMYRSLLHQLLLSVPTTSAEFRQAFQVRSRSEGDPGKDWDWHVTELHAFFLTAVEHVAEIRPVNIFVDALDEASDGNDDRKTRHQILSDFHELNDLLHNKKLRSTICFSCRHQPVVATNQARDICVEEGNQADISVYVREELYKWLTVSEAEQQYLAELGDAIARRAQGVFQWATLVVHLVIRDHNDGRSRMEITQRLEEVPEELDDVYEHIVRKVIDKKDYPDALRLMSLVYLAERPLNVTEISFAMSLPKTELLGLGLSLAEPELRSNDMMVKRISSLSGGLIETTKHRSDHIVQFIHQSINDFLSRNGLRFFDKTVQDPIGQGHHQFSLICANYMRIAKINNSNKHDAAFITNKFQFIDYVIRSWFLHAEKAETRGVPQDYLLRYIQCYPSMLEDWVRFYQILDPYYSSERRPEGSSTLFHIASGTGLLSVVKGLLLAHPDLEQTDGNGNRALHYASRWGHTEVVKALLDAGANYQAENKSKCTVLERAAANGHTEIVRLLLSKGADVHKHTGGTGNALYGAAKKGSRAIVQMLLDSKAGVNAQGGYYGNALQAAAHGGHQAVVQLLLDNQADVNAQGGHYGNALQAAADGGHQAVVQLLLDNQADVNAQGGDYGNALQAAAAGGHQAVVQLLLDNQADVNAQGGGFGNALQAAAYRGPQAVVQLLLDNQADVNAQGGDYGNALQAAAYGGHQAVVQLLLDNQADVNAQGGDYGNALQAAAYGGHQAVVQLLLNNQADVNAQGGGYGNALQAAAYRGHQAVVQLLLNNQADVNAQGGYYSNALQAAVVEGHQAVVQLLLDNQADITRQDNQGRCPLHLAIRGGHQKLIDLILSNISIPDWKYQDLQGCSALHFAASGGSDQIIQVILESDNNIDINLIDTYGWTALHWACRNGSHKIVHMLRRSGANLYQKDINGWTPFDIATFCQNESLASLLQDDTSEEESKQSVTRPGKLQHYYCSSCYHNIYGSRHNCKDCQFFSLCFRCITDVARIHQKGHSFEVIEG